MISAEDVGGTHVKYLYHCRRQLWLFLRGYRPERRDDLVAYGEAVGATTYSRKRDVDLGEARIDWIENRAVVHESKSSRRPNPAHAAQVRLYCDALERRGVGVRRGVVHYPLIRRTVEVPWDAAARAAVRADRAAVLDVASSPLSPPRLDRPACKGCSYVDYCWGDER